jgi:hypothetical protein
MRPDAIAHWSMLFICEDDEDELLLEAGAAARLALKHATPRTVHNLRKLSSIISSPFKYF